MAVTNVRGSRRTTQHPPKAPASGTPHSATGNCQTSRSKPPSWELSVFEALAAINQGFERLLTGLDDLNQLGLFRQKYQRPFKELSRITLLDLRAWTNLEAVRSVIGRCERDYDRYGVERQSWEEKYNAAHDTRDETRDAKSVEPKEPRPRNMRGSHV